MKSQPEQQPYRAVLLSLIQEVMVAYEQKNPHKKQAIQMVTGLFKLFLRNNLDEQQAKEFVNVMRRFVEDDEFAATLRAKIREWIGSNFPEESSTILQ